MKSICWLGLSIALLSSSPLLAHSDHHHQTREQIALKKIQQGALIIDVRSDADYKTQHIKGAIQLPVAGIIAQLQQRNIDKMSPIVLYGKTGHLSGKAALLLRQAGYENVHNGGAMTALLTQKHAH